MRVVEQSPFEPNAEIDEVRWLDPPAARELLDYEHDRRLLAALAPTGDLGREGEC
jgi:hypothetical protein